MLCVNLNLINMNILWFSWKDIEHPLAGGAEVVTDQILQRLVRDGHQVKLITANFPKSKQSTTTINGYEVIRLGNRFSVYWQAYKYYKKNLQDWADITIEEINTIPFFTKFYTQIKNSKSKSKSQRKHFLFFHQLAREIWFYEMIFPLSLIGYLLEPIYLYLLSDQKVITVSNSTKLDLQKYHFSSDNIQIISEGVHLTPIDLNSEKYQKPTLLSLGTVRSMKRTLHQLQAFTIAKKQIPDLQFKIAGQATGKYGEKFLKAIANNPYQQDIQYFGRVDSEQKQELMQKSHLILVTSLKEGWGLIVSEAGSQGTPAVVYDVDGLRDAVENRQAGFMTSKNTPQELAQQITSALSNPQKYQEIQKRAWEKAKTLTFEQAYQDFKKIIFV